MNRWIVTTLLALLAIAGPATAAPGAHGPNGEHLDAPSAQTAGGADDTPRFEAQTDQFELVGRLQGGELSLLVNRYATNEPLLGAQVEVQSGERTARATFHADLGDYAVDDVAFLEQVSAPGEHALVITVIAGEESDLLDATLRVAAAATAAHDHGSTLGELLAHEWKLILSVIAVLAALVAFEINRKKRRARRQGSAHAGGHA